MANKTRTGHGTDVKDADVGLENWANGIKESAMAIDRRGNGDSTKFKAIVEIGRDYTHCEWHIRVYARSLASR